MKKLIFLIILFFACTFIQAQCFGPSQKKINEENTKAMDSWMGSHKSALIQSWGAPTRYDSDGKGGEILIYETSTTVGTYLYGIYSERTIVNYKEMFANENGILYYWRTGTR